MESEPKLLLDTKQWPLPFLLFFFLVFGGSLYLIDASVLFASTLLMVFYAAGWIEEIWKREAYFSFTRKDDPLTFWFMLVLIAAVFMLLSALLVISAALRVSP